MAVIVAKEHRLPYTASEFDAKIAKIDELSDAIENISADYVIEQNNQSEQKFWRGTKAEYDAIENKDEDVFYIVTDSEATYDVVTSFNGRIGEITPQDGDYNANMITFVDGETIQQKFDNGDLAGTPIAIGEDEPSDTDIWIDTNDNMNDELEVVLSFNGRYGEIVPQSGDYTAEMVGADTVGSAASALASAKTYTDTVVANVGSAIKWDNITVATTAWAASGNYYTATVVVQDMLATDNPHSVDIVRSSDLEADALCEKAFALVKRITTAAGSITLYATEIPAVNFTIWMEGTR